MYILLTIQHFVDATPTATSLFNYESEDGAMAALYSTMASGMANSNISKIICEILTDVGGIEKYERWERTEE